MRTFLSLMVVSSLLLSACSGWRDSRVNPSNWFGGSRPASAPIEAEGAANPLIPVQTGILRRDKRDVYEGTLVASIEDLVIERTSSGAIVRVTGQSAMQGAFDVRLVEENDGEPVDGVLTYSLKAIQPSNQGRGSANARTVRAGEFVSRQVLERTSTIQVLGAENARTTRRR